MREENTLVLNQRTVMEAVQAYLDRHITPPVKLTRLVPNASYEPYTYTATFNEIAEQPGSEAQKPPVEGA